MSLNIAVGNQLVQVLLRLINAQFYLRPYIHSYQMRGALIEKIPADEPNKVIMFSDFVGDCTRQSMQMLTSATRQSPARL